MAAQLSQQNFSMAPDQAFLQFLPILPDSEYKVEKRTCSTGQRLDRDQVLLMVRTRYDNLQRQRNKGGGRRDVGHAFTADAGSSAGGRSTPGAEVGVGAGAETEEKKVATKRMTKQQTSMPAKETSTAVREATQGATVVIRPATKRCNTPDRCVAFAAERAIRRKYAPTSSPSLPAKLTRVAATTKGFSAEKSRTPSSAMQQAKVFDEPGKWSTNALAWQLGDLPVICDNGASCHTSHSSTGMIHYREANATMRTASGKRFPIEGYGDLPFIFLSSSGEVPLLLCNVAHVPSLSYHLFP